ncbi:hypothetical protein Leryth_001440 [Lithospermum erythrorhizon]|nr:hypothetical protein Leryth_001440 [Lithospermum erythrorhizon]
MAPRTEKEETEFNIVPESITPCINNCTLTINPTTATSSSPATSAAPPPSSPSPRLSEPSSICPRLSAAAVVVVKREVNRCWGCRRKVGLSGFRCRCGELFCSIHRYSDRHDCTYDYKSAGREAIERENPLVKAAKIVRI